MNVSDCELLIKNSEDIKVYTKEKGFREGKGVAVINGSLVFKEFFHDKHHDADWVIEDTVIRYLSDSGVTLPDTYGYICDEQSVRYYKSFVVGEHIKPVDFNENRIIKLAQLFRTFHQQLVITRDAHTGNVIETPEGEITFIDFGKSLIYKKASPSYFLSITRELYKVQIKLLGKDTKKMAVFYREYRNNNNTTPFILRLLLPFAFKLLALRDTLKRQSKRRRTMRKQH